MGKADRNSAELWKTSGNEAVNGLSLITKEISTVVLGIFFPSRD